MSIHELARTAPSADFSSLCSACSLFVSRTIDASAKSSENASAVDVYRATLADFMSRKSSSVHPAFLTDYMRRFPVQAWPLRTDLCGYVARGAGLNTYHQTQAYGMLQILTSQLGSIAKAVGASEVTDYVQRVSGDVFETLEAAAGSETEWYAARLKEVVKFALQLARTSRSVLSDHAASEIWDTQKLAEVTAKVKEGERTKEMKSVHGLLQQLAAILTSKGEKKEKTTQKRTGTDDMDVDGTALTKGRSPQLGVKSAPNGYAHSNGKKAKTDKQGRVSETVSVDPTGEKKVNGHIGDLPKEKKPKSTEGLTMACKSRTDVEENEDTHRKKHKSSIRAS